jgi:Beta-propeller repeat
METNSSVCRVGFLSPCRGDGLTIAFIIGLRVSLVMFVMRVLLGLIFFFASVSLALFAAQSRRVDSVLSAPHGGVQQAWVARYNGPANDSDGALANAVDLSGNVYVTGWSVGSGTGFDYATIKYDSAGQKQWAARYNGPANDLDEGQAIVLDKSGNIYVTGFSFGLGGYFGYATIKYDSAGQEQWVARYNGPGMGNDFALDITVDESANVYVTGESFVSDQCSDYATVKYNSAGQEQWIARYGLRSGDCLNGASAISVDASGNVYVTGRSSSDYATIKYNSVGERQWVARYDGPRPLGNDADGASAIAIDDSGNVYVTGFSVGLGGDYDYATIKYDSAGQEQWVARYNGPANDWDLATDIAVDRSGDVYVSGESVGTTFPDYDYATIKYDLSGQEQWVARYNGPGNGEDDATGIVLDSLGNVYVTGSSEGSGATFDYATIKYDSAGHEQWLVRYEGPGNSYDIGRAIAIDQLAQVYVTGNSFGSGTDSDYLTLKYIQGAGPTPTPTATASATATPTATPRPPPTPRPHVTPRPRP